MVGQPRSAQAIIARYPAIASTALIVNGSGTIEKRTVTTRRAIDDQWLIGEGLKAGDRLVVQGVSKVHVGDAVKVVDVTASLTASN